MKFEVEYEDLPGVHLRVLAPKLRGSPEAMKEYLQRLQAMSPRQFGWLVRYLPELPDWAMEEEVQNQKLREPYKWSLIKKTKNTGWPKKTGTDIFTHIS